jgi:demethylmenaquinone methyltransferase/2-methoxy-6-polyprenyl-1,4-benzoquinol methylase
VALTHLLREAEALPVGAQKRARIRAMFDRIAPRYDALNRVLSAGFDRGWRRSLLDAAGVGAGDLVLDVACGTGDLAELAASRGARVVGVDFAREMLRGARRRSSAAGLVQGDAAALPFASRSASVVTCGFALRNFVDLDEALVEMARVLVPRGRLALLEVDRPGSAWLRRVHAAYFDRVVPRIGALLSDRDAYAYLPRSTAYLPAAAELGARIEAAGFREVLRRPLLLGAAQLWTARRSEDAR